MTTDEFFKRYPEFLTQTPARVNLLIADAAPYFDVCVWGDFYAQGLGYFVAHALALSTQSRAGIETTSRSVGDVSISKSDAGGIMAMKDPFMRTGYGQEYRRLQRLVGSGAYAL